MPRRGQPRRPELLDLLDWVENAIRTIGSDWADDVLPDTRLRLLRIANEILDTLIRAGRR